MYPPENKTDAFGDIVANIISGLIWLAVYVMPIVAVVLVANWGYNHFFKKPSWTGYFYYDLNDLDRHWKQSGLNSLDDCRNWVSDQTSRDFDGEYDYECGTGCRHDTSANIDICKTTER